MTPIAWTILSFVKIFIENIMDSAHRWHILLKVHTEKIKIFSENKKNILCCYI